jgi:hypothetical protein
MSVEKRFSSCSLQLRAHRCATGKWPRSARVRRTAPSEMDRGCSAWVCENRRHSGLSRIHRSRSLHQSLARGVHRTGRPTTRTMLLSSSTSPSPSRSAVACGRSSRKAVPPSPLPVAGIKHDTIDGFSRVPLARNFDFGGALHSRCQNKKYLCAIGSTSAGAQVSSSPLAVTS